MLSEGKVAEIDLGTSIPIGLCCLGIPRTTAFAAATEGWLMIIRIPLFPIEFEFIARRRTRPFRIRLRTLLIVTAVVAVIIYLFLPLSPADRRLRAIYEHLVCMS